jgi:hypothetical protein
MQRYKTQITKVIDNKKNGRQDMFEFIPVNNIKDGILYFKLKELKEKKGIDLKDGDEIYLEDKGIRYIITYKNEVIGRASKIVMKGSSNL